VPLRPDPEGDLTMRTPLVVLLLVALVVVAPPAGAQEESPGSDGQECRAGELCGPTEGEDPFGDTGPSVADPRGNHVRSLITIGLIAAFLGTYLFIALSGRNPFKRKSA
jgi:hypothetical protein